MTQDTNPTLTEDAKKLINSLRYSTWDYEVKGDIVISDEINRKKSHNANEEYTEQLKQQILTVLDQFPKLKEEYGKLIESKLHSENLLIDEIKKLKAENEELKQTMILNNNTFDSLHKEKDGLNVRVSRLLNENQKLNTKNEELVNQAFDYSRKLTFALKDKEKLQKFKNKIKEKLQSEIIPLTDTRQIDYRDKKYESGTLRQRIGMIRKELQRLIKDDAK